MNRTFNELYESIMNENKKNIDDYIWKEFIPNVKNKVKIGKYTVYQDDHSGSLSIDVGGEDDILYITPYWEEDDGLGIEYIKDNENSVSELVPFNLTFDVKKDIKTYVGLVKKFMKKHKIV